MNNIDSIETPERTAFSSTGVKVTLDLPEQQGLNGSNSSESK